MTDNNNSKLIFLKDLENLNYEELKFKCGVEIHQQLNSGKLFCSCPCDVVDNSTFDKSIERKLRFATSETGQIDSAAISEFKKDKYNIYEYNNKISCLVDLDEEPPKGPNEKALNVAVRISQMMSLKLFSKIQFMRKLIIDGSITSGYQRTAMLGINGKLETSFGKVNINGINLEEDSCRTLQRFEDHTIFALDRQGIPLIEITTGPQIKTAQGVLETASKIGNILRSFKETRRGLGTIRQDLNISIENKNRVEIKGTQNLKLIPQIVNAEIRRQKIHNSIIDELKNRRINKDNFSDNKIYDITNIFDNSTSKVILDNLEDKNSKVLAIKLFKFKDILKHELNKNYRFGTEISNRNKQHFPMVKGLFHSDELPRYGIEQEEVDKIFKQLDCKKDDSFILIAQGETIAKNSLENILEIIKQLIIEMPEEVRQVDPKGDVTQPLRPMPGSARMYPETDISDIEFESEYLEEMKNQIPELYSSKMKRLEKEFNIDEDKIENILSKFSEEEFIELTKIGIDSKTIYSIVFDTPKEIKKREKIEPIELDFKLMKNIITSLKNENLSKNNIYKLFVLLFKTKITSIEDFDKFLEENNLKSIAINKEEIEEKIKEIISQNPKAPMGALMGICMKHFAGSVEGKIISELLKKNIPNEIK